MKKYLLIFLVFLFLPCVSQAGMSSELSSAVQKIFQGSFEAAKSITENYIQKNPDDPNGYLVRGMANEWYQLARNKGKSLNQKIMQDYQLARRKAELLLEKDKNNLDLKVDLGVANMYIAKKQIDTGHKMQAGFSLKKAKNLMEEVLAKDSGHVGAYFPIGLFNYFAANVPAGFRWLANLVGFKGERSKGLQYINKAAAVQNITQNDALYMLHYIYSQKEGKYEQAIAYTRQLHSKYPANNVFLFDYAEMLFRTKQLSESRNKFNDYFSWCDAHASHCSQEFQYLANYFMAWSYVIEKNYKEARPYLQKALKLDTKRFKDRTADMNGWAKKVGL